VRSVVPGGRHMDMRIIWAAYMDDPEFRRDFALPWVGRECQRVGCDWRDFSGISSDWSDAEKGSALSLVTNLR
jgi:hypothetical protein